MEIAKRVRYTLIGIAHSFDLEFLFNRFSLKFNEPIEAPLLKPQSIHPHLLHLRLNELTHW